jgi:D-aspartate ligase
MTATVTTTDRNQTVGAIVLGGNFVGLGIVRSLGRRGIPVWVVDADRTKSIAQFSRYTKRFIESRQDVHELLLKEGQEHDLKGWVIFPVSDEYVEAVSTHHRSLSAIYRLVTPPLEITRFAIDKRLTYSKARELGIAAPWTAVSGASVESCARDARYPAILKPAVNHHFFPHTNIKALAASSPSELLQRHAQMSRFIPSDEILIQERIPGDGENQYSYCAVCVEGRVRVGFVARRRRQYPVDFGNASSFVETMPQPKVEADGRRFLEGIGFDGMAEVEFKFDPRDGQHKILDVNPRPWGWHTLSGAAGVDFAYLLWQIKVGMNVPDLPPLRHAAWIREITDVLAIAKSPRRGQEITQLLKWLLRWRVTPATFSFLDPMPFVGEFVLWASHGGSRQKVAREALATECYGIDGSQTK